MTHHARGHMRDIVESQMRELALYDLMAPVREAESLREHELALANMAIQARKAKQRKEKEEHEQKLLRFVERMQHLYGDALFAYREDDRAVERFAVQQRARLLRNTGDIAAAYQYFHTTAPWDGIDFASYLKRRHPGLYRRVEEVFNYRALAIARRPRPARPGNRADERLSRDQRRYEGEATYYREMAFRRYEAERDFIEDLAERFPHLDDDQLIAELERFREEMEGKAQSDSGNTNKANVEEY